MLVESYTHELIAKVKNGELDLIIIALPIDEPGLVAQPVYDEDFRVLLPKTHAWAKQDGIEAEHLLDQPLLMLGAGNCFRDQVLDLCTRATNSPSPQVIEGSSLETIRLMVASGLGITVMPASAVDPANLTSPLLAVKHFADPTPAPPCRSGLAQQLPAFQSRGSGARGGTRLPPAGHDAGGPSRCGALSQATSLKLAIKIQLNATAGTGSCDARPHHPWLITNSCAASSAAMSMTKGWATPSTA